MVIGWRECNRGRRLPDLLSPVVNCNDLLPQMYRPIAADPSRRCSSAQAADLDRKGAADFHRQPVKGDLASKYESDIRGRLEQLG